MYFKKILVVNRGEIAVRIINACKELGIKTAAIYSDIDKTAIHSKLADEAYLIEDDSPTNVYLNIDKIISLTKRIDADAIHPGYGFLSENPSFIKKVEENGITFIGPSSNSVEMMGSKIEARKLMKEAGIPVVPGTTEPIYILDEAIKICDEIGYPILLKASAGGGGKGMKKVYSKEELKPAFESAQREAMKAFGDDTIYIEKLIENPRHIEVQILGDKFGNYIHLFERECSIQRRFQKVIEEAPSPFVDEKTRKKITSMAVNAAKVCKYYNAGTIECLMDKNKNFYFLEMNTRIQVEHPITEMITGVDIVKEQIKIAAGEKLSFKQSDIMIRGHAIECRIYAEDPFNGFLPTTGEIKYYRIPTNTGIRLDSGVEKDSIISVHYDPILAKLIVLGSDRNTAIQKMRNALNQIIIAPLINNLQFLMWVLNQERFINGDYHINYIEEEIKKSKYKDWMEKINDEFKDISFIAAALLKNYSQEKISNNKNYINQNLWINQSYD